MKPFTLLLMTASAILAGCTVDLQRCSDDETCPTDQVCRLGGCVLGDVGPADVGPADGGPADVGSADVGPADVGPTDVGPIDLGPPLDLPIELAGPQRLTELGDAEFRVARFEIMDVPPNADLRLILTAIDPPSGCMLARPGSFALVRTGMALFEATLTGLNLPYGCHVDFETDVRLMNRSAAGPQLTVDNAPPAFDRRQVEIWPTTNGHILVVDPADAVRADFYETECSAPSDAPVLDALLPDPGSTEWTLAGLPRTGALVLRDDRGNIRCESIDHARPETPTIARTHCLAEQQTQIVIENASAMRTFCLGDPSLQQTPGHRPVLQGACSPAGETCEAFVRLGPPGLDAQYGAVTIQSHAEPVVHFTGPTRFALDGANPVSHARVGDTLFVGTDGGFVARFDIDADQQWSRAGNILTNGGGGDIHLSTTTVDGEPVLWVANHLADGRITRCVGAEFACVEGDVLSGRIVAFATAQLDADAELEVVACTPDGLSIQGLGNAGFVAGPSLGNAEANLGCRGIAAGRLRPGRLDSLVATLASSPTTIRRIDRVADEWQFVDFTVFEAAGQPHIDDVDGDGLDELFAVHADDPNLGRFRRIAEVDGSLAVVRAGDEINLIDRPVIQGTIGDVDQDGVPDLLAIEAIEETGRLVYRVDGVERSTTLMGTQVHRVDTQSDDLVVYAEGQLIRLQPSRPTTDLRWPAPLPGRMDGRLELAGFDLNGNQRDEFFFVGLHPDGRPQSAGFYEVNALGEFEQLQMTANLPIADYRAAQADVNGDGFDDIALAATIGDTIHVRVVYGGFAEPLAVERFDSLPPVNENNAPVPHVLLDISAAPGEVYVQTQVGGVLQINTVLVNGPGDSAPMNADSIGATYVKDTVDAGDEGIRVRPFVLGCQQSRPTLSAQTVPALRRAQSIAMPPDSRCHRLRAQHPSLPGLPLAVVSATVDGSLAQLVTVTAVDPITLLASFDMPTTAAPTSIDLVDFDGDLVPEIVTAVPTLREVPSAVSIIKTGQALTHRYDKRNHAGPNGNGLGAAGTLTAFGGEFDGDGLRDLLIYQVTTVGVGQFFVYPARN